MRAENFSEHHRPVSLKNLTRASPGVYLANCVADFWFSAYFSRNRLRKFGSRLRTDRLPSLPNRYVSPTGIPRQVWSIRCKFGNFRCKFARREFQRTPSARFAQKFNHGISRGIPRELCSGFSVFGLLFEKSSPKVWVSARYRPVRDRLPSLPNRYVIPLRAPIWRIFVIFGGFRERVCHAYGRHRGSCAMLLAGVHIYVGHEMR